VAGHRLIDAAITALARRLPADAVDELADGLTETYQRHVALGLPPDAAARAAIAEFGAPDLIVAAFVQQAPGRQMARALLSSGPLVGGCWAVALIAGDAWAWTVPVPARLILGLALVATVAVLAVAATARRSYRRTGITTVGGAGLIVLDAAMLTCVALEAPAATWPLTVAVIASLARIALTARMARHLISR
jgi:hypothetical protein